MSGKRNVSVCRGHELVNTLYVLVSSMYISVLLLIQLEKVVLLFEHIKSLGEGFFFYFDLFVC